MRVLKVKVFSLPYIFQVLYVLCFTGTRHQVSVYRTIGPLVGRMGRVVYIFVTLAEFSRSTAYKGCKMGVFSIVSL